MIGSTEVSVGFIFKTVELEDCLWKPCLACRIFTDAKNKRI